MSDLHIIYITCPDLACAKAIAGQVVNERLAACANLLPGMTSLYRWQDQLQEAQEVVLILKTREARLAPCIERVKALHPYDTPCIVAWLATVADPTFAAWVGEATRKPMGG